MRPIAFLGRWVVPAVVLLVLGGCAPTTPTPIGSASPVPTAAGLQPPGLDELFSITGLWGLATAPGTELVLVTLDRDGGVPSPWLLPVEGGEAQRLGPSDGRATWAVALVPGGEGALVTRDGSGDELHGLLFAGRDGSLVEIGAAGRHVERFVSWGANGTTFFMTSNEREPTRFDLWSVNLGSFERRLVAELPAELELEVVSRSGRWALLSDMVWTGDIDTWLLDLNDGTLRLLSPDGVEGVDVPVGFDAAEQQVFLRSSIGRDVTALVVQDLASGRRRPLLEREWNVESVVVSPAGSRLVALLNEDARMRPVVLEGPDFEPVGSVETSLTPEMGTSQLDISRVAFLAEDRVVMLASSPQHSRDVWAVSLEAPSSARRLSDTAADAFLPQDLPAARIYRFNSFDGLEIPGVLYPPGGRPPVDGWPGVVWVHGGPGGQSTLAFNPLLSAVANAGYMVLAINHRGSDGYGREFSQLDDRRHGVDDVADCVASIEALARDLDVDPERVAIAGASYGGYVTLAALTFRPEAFAAGVDFFGPSNWARTLGALRPERESVRRALERELGDPDDVAFLRAKSPLFHAGNIRRPLLVVQGANDRRVLPEESSDIVEAARRAGATVEYLEIADEGHGFSKRENRMLAYRLMLGFLDRHLRAED